MMNEWDWAVFGRTGIDLADVLTVKRCIEQWAM